MGRLDGKVALILGGSEGIGFAAAEQFIIEGAKYVFIVGRRQDVLDNAVQKLGTKNVIGVQGDISDMSDLDRLYSVIKDQANHLDVLFANAGTFESAPLGLITEEQYDRIFNTNVKGILFAVQKALPIFVDGGSIILNGSVYAVKGVADRSIYSASKAALRSFTRCWAVDLKERKIKVNIIHPGPIDTATWKRDGVINDETKAFMAKLEAATVMGRFGMSHEVAKAVVFLASDDSSYVTGIELFVDGGFAQT